MFFMKKFFTLVALAVMAFASQANVLSVCQEDWYSSYFPVYGLWYDTPGTTQQIYPADMLTEMVDGDITEISFLTLSNLVIDGEDFSDYTVKFHDGELQLAIMVVDEIGFTDAAFFTGAQVVATMVPTAGEAFLTFTLDEPFHYTGGNLLLEVNINTPGGYGTTYFMGAAMVDENDEPIYYPSYMENLGYSGTLYNSGMSAFLPAVDFTYEASTIPVEPTEMTAAPTFNGYTTDGIHAYFVEIIPTEPSTIYYRVFFPDGTQTDWAEYEDILSFTGNGMYRVEAYAVAPGKLESYPIAYEFVVSPMTGLTEMAGDKAVASQRFFNAAGQEMSEANGLTIVVTTYTDGTTSTAKVMK